MKSNELNKSFEKKVGQTIFVVEAKNLDKGKVSAEEKLKIRLIRGFIQSLSKETKKSRCPSTGPCQFMMILSNHSGLITLIPGLTQNPPASLFHYFILPQRLIRYILALIQYGTFFKANQRMPPVPFHVEHPQITIRIQCDTLCLGSVIVIIINCQLSIN